MPLKRSKLNKWVAYLRKHPEKQSGHFLCSIDNKKMCCLGALAHISKLKFRHNGGDKKEYIFRDNTLADTTLLFGNLALELGSGAGYFDNMGIPQIEHGGHMFVSLVSANDAGVPWSVIADHLEKYYPAVED